MKQVALLNIFDYILAYIHLLMKSIEGNWWGQTDGSAIKTAAALPEDLILFPTPMSQLTTACDYNSSESSTVCWPLGAPAHTGKIGTSEHIFTK